MNPSDATRARWRAATQAHERLVASFRALLASQSQPHAVQHEAKRELLGSLIHVGRTVKTTSLDLLDVDLSYGADDLPVEWHLPNIIDIESEEDPPCPTS